MTKGISLSYSTVKRVLDKVAWGKPRQGINSMKLDERVKKDRLIVSKYLIKQGFTDSLSGTVKSRRILFTDEKSIYLVSTPNRKNHVIRTDLNDDFRRIQIPKFNFEKVYRFAAEYASTEKPHLLSSKESCHRLAANQSWMYT